VETNDGKKDDSQNSLELDARSGQEKEVLSCYVSVESAVRRATRHQRLVNGRFVGVPGGTVFANEILRQSQGQAGRKRRQTSDGCTQRPRGCLVPRIGPTW